MVDSTAHTSGQPPTPPQTAAAASPASIMDNATAIPTALPSFYKRPLPPSCISFDSPEGKKLFKQAMQEGYMDGYYSLAQSFLTQNEPAYCGLATLCMILNSLGVDPQKQFKGPWRYYVQEMLDCCRSLSDVQESGITLAEFACLARCNGLREHTRYGTMVSLEEFERDIERVCGENNDGSVMAISYSRKSLGQTGDGHFSPIAGYCKSSKRVLVLDVARFKYPSYWVGLEDLYASLIPVDKATNQPRGYSILRTASNLTPNASPTTGLFSLNFNKQSWPAFLQKLKGSTSSAQPTELVAHLVSLLHSTQIKPLQQRNTTSQETLDKAASQQQLDPVPTKLMSDLYDAEVRQLVSSMKSSSFWKLVTEALRKDPPPFPYDSHYPQALGYSLFIHSLLTSISAPAELRHAWHAAVESHDLIVGDEAERVQKEVRFLQDQMASLERCCSTEEACGCMGKGVQIGASCKV